MALREVLIIEDDPTFRKVIKRALADDGYSFLEAASIVNGLEICKDQSPSVILLDLELPGANGKDFLQRLGDDISKYRVIVLTAHEEYLAAELAREYQVFRYLPKSARITEALRFTVSQAFKDIDREQLQDKTGLLIEIQQRINTDIQESTSSEATQTALTSVLTLICASVRKLVRAYTVHVRTYNLQRGDFHLTAFDGPNDVIGEILTLPKRKTQPLSGTVAEQNRSLHYYDLQSEPEFQLWKQDSLTRLRDFGNDTLLRNAEEYFKRVESAYLVPITTHLFADEVDAVFNVSADTANFFSAEKQVVIKEFVGQATAAITNAWQKLRKHEAHQDYRNINKVLEDISKALRNENAKPEIYDIVIRGISEIVKPEAISIYLHNKTTGVLDNEAEFRGAEQHEPSTEGHPIDKGLTARVFSTGMPLRVPNLQAGDRRKPAEHPDANKGLYDKYVALLPSGRVDHYLAVPMIIGDEVIGAVQLLNKKSDYYQDEKIDRERWLLERGFSDDCENVLGIAASHLAVSIKNAELLQDSSKQISQLAILKDVGRFTSSETQDQLWDKIIRQAAQEADAEMCLLFLLDESKTKIVLRQRYGISEQELPEASYEIDEGGITGSVIASGTSKLFKKNVPKGKYDEQILNHLQNTYGEDKQIESLMIVPIVGESDVLGAIKIINKKTDNPYYDEDDVKFFEHFATYVGLAIENTQRYEAAIRKLAAAESNSTLSSLVRSVAHEVNHTFGLIPDDVIELKDLLPDRTPQQEEILDEIDRLATQMVYYSNEISGYHIGEKELLDINKVVKHAVRQIPIFRLSAKIETIPVNVELSDEPLECLLNEGPLTRIIRNIVINAYQALEGRDDGRISVRTYKDGKARMAKIEISDNGCGIKEEYREKIFLPHFTTKTGKGTGIGLWLVKTHIESISGTIEFTSTENKGTTFTLGSTFKFRH